jgi:GT2 family glycosyltransferase
VPLPQRRSPSQAENQQPLDKPDPIAQSHCRDQSNVSTAASSIPPTNASPLVSVVILNYNGARWLKRCLASLERQTILGRLEIIVADNLSTDDSAALAEELVRPLPNAVFVQHGQNLGYCEGNNRAARLAKGHYIFFLNNDTWLEPDCLDALVKGLQAQSAHAACPFVLNYEDDSFQSAGASGFDLFGLSSTRKPAAKPGPIFMPEGCAYLIERAAFEALGGFDRVMFMFSDEFDLSWRLWSSGRSAVTIPSARLHHRGAANVNPHGAGQVLEMRTSDTKRFYANRNGLLVVAKNAQHLLLGMILLQLLLLCFEAAIGLVLVRRWQFIENAYLRAFREAWQLRHHIRIERARLGSLRCRSDWWMLRFLRIRPNRWDEVVRMVHHGIPKVTAN